MVRHVGPHLEACVRHPVCQIVHRSSRQESIATPDRLGIWLPFDVVLGPRLQAPRVRRSRSLRPVCARELATQVPECMWQCRPRPCVPRRAVEHATRVTRSRRRRPIAFARARTLRARSRSSVKRLSAARLRGDAADPAALRPAAGPSMSLSESRLQRLTEFDTPPICNALELIKPDRSAFGYTRRTMFPVKASGPLVLGELARTVIGPQSWAPLSPRLRLAVDRPC
jgi:hypothetical protein